MRYPQPVGNLLNQGFGFCVFTRNLALPLQRHQLPAGICFLPHVLSIDWASHRLTNSLNSCHLPLPGNVMEVELHYRAYTDWSNSAANQRGSAKYRSCSKMP